MKNSILTPRVIFITIAVVAAALTRFLPHPPNFTAIGGMALFAGAFIPNRWLSLLVPAIAMIVTDAFIGFHNTWWAVYMSFGLITMLGWVMQKQNNAGTFIATSLIASILFFFLTNAAMWVVGFWTSEPLIYPTTAGGLADAIAAGIPFYSWNFLVSQLVYGGILFGGFYAIKAWKPSLVAAE